MGGETKFLSKRNKLADYVKNDEDVAEITVTLHKDCIRHNHVTIRRQFNRQNESTFHIDGQIVSQEEYCAQINALNIHVENLCQMLPEKCVQDLYELLAGAQKSVCI